MPGTCPESTNLRIVWRLASPAPRSHSACDASRHSIHQQRDGWPSDSPALALNSRSRSGQRSAVTAWNSMVVSSPTLLLQLPPHDELPLGGAGDLDEAGPAECGDDAGV